MQQALRADGGFNERVSLAVLQRYGIQCQFFPWRADGRISLWLRISAQVYNTIADYEAVAAALLDMRRAEGGCAAAD